MEEIIKLDEVDKYNKFFGLETRHPLVSVVDLSKATRWPEHFRINYWVYALFLTAVRVTIIRTGRSLVSRPDRSWRPRCRKIPGRMPTVSCSTPT